MMVGHIFTVNFINHSAKTNHVEIIKKYLDLFPREIDNVINETISHNNRSFLNYLINHSYVKDLNQVIEYAVYNGQSKIFFDFINKATLTDDDRYKLFNSSVFGQLDIVKYLFHPSYLDNDTLYFSLTNDNLDIVKFIVKQGAYMDVRIMDRLLLYDIISKPMFI